MYGGLEEEEMQKLRHTYQSILGCIKTRRHVSKVCAICWECNRDFWKERRKKKGKERLIEPKDPEKRGRENRGQSQIEGGEILEDEGKNWTWSGTKNREKKGRGREIEGDSGEGG